MYKYYNKDNVIRLCLMSLQITVQTNCLSLEVNLRCNLKE